MRWVGEPEGNDTEQARHAATQKYADSIGAVPTGKLTLASVVGVLVVEVVERILTEIDEADEDDDENP